MRRIRQFFGNCRLIDHRQRGLFAIFSVCCNLDTVVSSVIAFSFNALSAEKLPNECKARPS